MHLTLKRFHSDTGATLGILMVKDRPDPVWYTVERPWKGNEPKVSCIPTGTYNVAPYDGTKFKDVWEIQNVPGRSAILFHPGNHAEDLEGCIAPGLACGYVWYLGNLHKGVTSSRNAIAEMKKILGYPSSFKLTITD